MSLTQVAPPRLFTSEQVFDNFVRPTKHNSPPSATMTQAAPTVSKPQQSQQAPPKATKEESVAADSNTPERDPSMIIYEDFVDPSHTTEQHITVGGRKSILAVVQSKLIAKTLRDECPKQSFPVVALSTLGDKVLSKPLYSFGGKSLWTKELETLLMNDIEGLPQLDMIVHSLKDMPTALPEGCTLGAITKREDPRDALIMPVGSDHKTLRDLPDGSVVGTSSIRRSAQLKRNYPNLIFESVRGNVQTRLAKVDDPNGRYACIILAVAGLNRLGLGHRVTSCLDAPDMYYAVGQGALGIEIRTNDEKVMKLLSKINHNESFLSCLAERSLMRTLEGGCSVPIGVQTTFVSQDRLKFTALVVSVDGTECVEATMEETVTTSSEAEELGKKLAHELIKNGAKAILDAIHLDAIH